MKYKATITFCGVPVSARTGEILEISDENVAADLIKAGHIVPTEEAEPEKESTKPAKKPAKGKKNEAE